mgnify:CR=1 FL=1
MNIDVHPKSWTKNLTFRGAHQCMLIGVCFLFKNKFRFMQNDDLICDKSIEFHK